MQEGFMPGKSPRSVVRQNPGTSLGLVIVAALAGPVLACEPRADRAIELGYRIPAAAEIEAHLYGSPSPRDRARLKAQGFIVMCPSDPPRSVVLPAGTFEFGSLELPEFLRAQLDAFAAVLRDSPDDDTVILVEGHANDSRAEPDAFDRSDDIATLTMAELVIAYLMQKGVAPARLQAIGLGSRVPSPGVDVAASDQRRIVLRPRRAQSAEPDSTHAATASGR
jgi:outer membrane protein OmpA-like peptidoglycan-associated protein